MIVGVLRPAGRSPTTVEVTNGITATGSALMQAARLKSRIRANLLPLAKVPGLVATDGVEQAINEAAAAIKDMHVSEELPESGEIWDLVIRDEDGTELKRIPS